VDVSTHRHELEADAHRRSVAELVLSVETPHVLDDPGERHSEAYAAEGLGGGAVDAHDELAEAGGHQPVGYSLVEQQRVGRHFAAQTALRGETDHVDEARMQERLAETHEGYGAGGFAVPAVAPFTVRTFADRLAEPIHDSLEGHPLHEPLTFVPSVPDAGRAVQVAGVGGLDVDLAQRVGAGRVAILRAAGRPWTTARRQAAGRHPVSPRGGRGAGRPATGS